MRGIEDDSRYRNIPLEKVREHYLIEKELREILLSSKKEDRQQVFQWAYTELFRRVPWHPALQEVRDGPVSSVVEQKAKTWLPLIGEAPKLVLEIGFGAGELLVALAEAGHTCVGIDAEVNRVEAMKKYESERLRVELADGTCPQVAEKGFDVAISQQLFEHLHPDDALEHLSSVRALLKPGGRYLLETPNRLVGPGDVSRFFVEGEAQGFHLREYSVKDLRRLLMKAGYRDVEVALWKRRLISGESALWLERAWRLLPRAVRRRYSLGLHNPIYVAASK